MKNWNINRVITPVNTKFGAPMGRSNIGSCPNTVTSGRNCKVYKKNQIKVYTKTVNLDSGGYDIGGAYWGLGSTLKVDFTADLKYIRFYRL